MSDFELDPRLAADTVPLAELDGTRILLMDNADYPWLILVPETQETEFHRLDPKRQQQLLSQINLCARFIDERFAVDKLNIATIGNVVAQLHIHIVGRRHDDPAWPGVVWGVPKRAGYDHAGGERIRSQLADYLESLESTVV